MKKKILVVVDAPGPASFIAPVVPLLKKRFEISVIAVKESPAYVLRAWKPIRCDKKERVPALWNRLHPDLLLVGTSALILGPHVNNEFTKLARRNGVPVICFQDYWANHRHAVNFKMMQYWDEILTIDELGKRLILKDGYRGKVVVTGNPDFDQCKTLNVKRARTRLRKKFGIPESAFVILYAGTGTPQSFRADEETYLFLAQAIRILKRRHPHLIFIAHPHPRDLKPSRYKKLAPDLAVLDFSKLKFAEKFLPMVDLVTSMYGTALVHACYLRIGGVSILLPKAGQERLAQVRLQDFPPNTKGATIGVYQKSVPRLGRVIESFRHDARHRAKIARIQKRYFPFPKNPAAVNVRDAVFQFMQRGRG